MSYKHIGFSESIVMKELEKIAVKTNMVKPDEPIIEKKASKKELTSSGDIFFDLITLAETLREKGYNIQAEGIEEKAVLFKKASDTIYNFWKEDGSTLLDHAHKVDDQDICGNKIEDLNEIQESILATVKKQPTGKQGGKKDQLVSMAADALGLKKNLIAMVASSFGLSKLAQVTDIGKADEAIGSKSHLKDLTAQKNIFSKTLDEINGALQEALKEPERYSPVYFANNIFTPSKDNRITEKFYAEDPEVAGFIDSSNKIAALLPELDSALEQSKKNSANITNKKYSDLAIITCDLKKIQDVININGAANFASNIDQSIKRYNIQLGEIKEKKDNKLQITNLEDAIPQSIEQLRKISSGTIKNVTDRSNKFKNDIVNKLTEIQQNINTNKQNTDGLDLADGGFIDSTKSIFLLRYIESARQTLNNKDNVNVLIYTTIPEQGYDGKLAECYKNSDNLISTDETISKNEIVSTDPNALLQAVKNAQNLLAQIADKRDDPGFKNLKNYSDKFADIYNVLQRANNKPLAQFKAWASSMKIDANIYKDAKSLVDDINSFIKNVNEAPALWGKKIQASNYNELIKEAAGNPFAPGGGGGQATPSSTGKPSGGGGGAVQPAAGNKVKEMQTAIKDLVLTFQTKFENDPPYPDPVKINGVWSKELDTLILTYNQIIARNDLLSAQVDNLSLSTLDDYKLDKTYIEGLADENIDKVKSILGLLGNKKYKQYGSQYKQDTVFGDFGNAGKPTYKDLSTLMNFKEFITGLSFEEIANQDPKNQYKNIELTAEINAEGGWTVEEWRNNIRRYREFVVQIKMPDLKQNYNKAIDILIKQLSFAIKAAIISKNIKDPKNADDSIIPDEIIEEVSSRSSSRGHGEHSRGGRDHDIDDDSTNKGRSGKNRNYIETPFSIRVKGEFWPIAEIMRNNHIPDYPNHPDYPIWINFDNWVSGNINDINIDLKNVIRIRKVNECVIAIRKAVGTLQGKQKRDPEQAYLGNQLLNGIDMYMTQQGIYEQPVSQSI